MYRLSYVLFQGIFLFAIHDEFILRNGAIHQADAKIKSEFTCQDGIMNLHCQPPTVIKIYRAEYSRKQDIMCNRVHNNAELCNPVDKMSLVRKLCEGQMACNVHVDNNTMGDICPTVRFKYLNVLYTCKKLPPSTEPPHVPTKSTMVLTRPSTLYQSPNESTGNPVEVVSYPYPSPSKEIEKGEESTSVVYGFVLYNGESVYMISSVLVALILALAIFS